MKLLKIAPVCLALAVCLAGCAVPSLFPENTLPQETVGTALPQETAAPTEDPALQVEEVTAVVTAAELTSLDQYPNLKKVDLSGSTCYDAILQYMAGHPQVEVTYTVSLGGLEVSNTTQELTIPAMDMIPETLLDILLRQLKYLPSLTSLDLPGTSLSAGQLDQLRESYPELNLSYTVLLLDTEYSWDTAALDLSSLKAEQIPEAAKAMAKLPKLASVELMKGGYSSLSKAEVKSLVEAAPWAVFHYEFTLFGRKVTSADTSLEFTKYTIGNEGVETLREALDIMPQCTYVKLDNCGIDNEVLAQLREDYRPRGTKIAWRIWFGKYTVMTDTEKIRAVYNVFDDTCHDLRYCEDVKYIDMGHNDTLSDLSWVGYMTNLEIMIVSGCAVTDLSGFENCKKLEFLELASCGFLEDISPLEGCESLKYLNISYTKVTDLMPLDGLPLERFVCLGPKVPAAERKTFEEIHEDCWIRFNGTQPYGIVWRYDDNGYTYSDIYRKIRDIFGYDDMPV